MILFRSLSYNTLEKCVFYCWIQCSLCQLFSVSLFGRWGTSVTADHTFTLKTPHYFRIFPLLHWILHPLCFYRSFMSFQTQCQREVHDPLFLSDSSAFLGNLIQMHISEKRLWWWLIVYVCSLNFSSELQIMFQLHAWHLHWVASSMAHIECRQWKTHRIINKMWMSKENDSILPSLLQWAAPHPAMTLTPSLQEIPSTSLGTVF